MQTQNDIHGYKGCRSNGASFIVTRKFIKVIIQHPDNQAYGHIILTAVCRAGGGTYLSNTI